MRNIARRSIIRTFSDYFYYLLMTNRVIADNWIKKKATKIQKHYEKLLQEKKSESIIRVGAYVVFDSTYGIDGMFRMMMSDQNHWNPMVVVIPDISRGVQHAISTYEKTKETFVDRYGEEYVLDGWDKKTKFYDPLDKFDIVYYANPYDHMVHEYHSILYATSKQVLPIYVAYGYDIGFYTTVARLRSRELNFVWKCFTDTIYSFKDYQTYQPLRGRNVCLAGYSKMDDYDSFKHTIHKRKKILFASHHSVMMKQLPLSTFLEYHNLILNLPSLFPEMDFVFRPHPLLFTTLINNNIWSDIEVSSYIDSLREKGIVYSCEGDYLHLFAECDAIINDCGSFTVEWLFTGKPGCFLLNHDLDEKYLTELMKKSLSHYSIAKTEDDIIRFIESIASIQPECEYHMEDEVRTNIAIHYPDVSSFILHEIDYLWGNVH